MNDLSTQYSLMLYFAIKSMFIWCTLSAWMH